MEVNIVEQLFPNVGTLLTQLCSTLVLFLIARHFLWPSVKRYLGARADKMQEELAQSEQAKQDALADRKVALEQLNTASAKSEEIVNAAIQQAKQEKKSIQGLNGIKNNALQHYINMLIYIRYCC